MGCCDEHTAWVPDTDLSRRTLFKGATVLAAAVPGWQTATAQPAGKKIKLALCGQLLCVIPYEVARGGDYFRRHGLDVELIYLAGGNAAMQAMIGNMADYAATALDVAIQAFARGADICRFATTGRLPLFALVTAPHTAGRIRGMKDLEGKTVGVSALGNADHALLLFLLKQAHADARAVRFTPLGVNLLETLRQGQVDAGLVQEPALTLLQRAGARVLVNAMDAADAHRHLGGDYEFMGVAVRGKEVPARRAEMMELAKALAGGLEALARMRAQEIVAVLPKPLTHSIDADVLTEIWGRYRDSLYPTSARIDLAASKRVAESLKIGGLLRPDTPIVGLHDTSIAGV